MQQSVNNVLIVVKSGDSRAPELARDMRVWFSARSVACETFYNRNGEDGAPLPLNVRPDLVVVLGGDGSMLSVSRRLEGLPVPLLGVNLGRVGFLTETCPETWREALTRVLEGRCRIHSRMTLDWSLRRGDRSVARGTVFNDVVINRGDLARLISLDVGVDGRRLSLVRADGLIISTPSGATAYSVSSGGPLVHPEVEAITVTPICSFLQRFRPIVVPATSEVSLTVTENRTEVHLTLDGQMGMDLREGDVVSVGRNGHGVRFIYFDDSWYSKLTAKGIITDEETLDP